MSAHTFHCILIAVVFIFILTTVQMPVYYSIHHIFEEVIILAFEFEIFLLLPNLFAGSSLLYHLIGS